MNILYFSPRPCWPLTTGARLRDYHLAHQLTHHAEVTYLGLYPAKAMPDPDPDPASGFKQVLQLQNDPAYTPAKLLRGLTGPHPVSVLNYTSPRIAAALETLLRSSHFDSVQIEGVHLVNYLPVIRAASPTSAILADWHNIESEILFRYSDKVSNPARRWFARRTAQLLQSSEKTLLAGCDAHTVTSEREQAVLERRAPLVKTIPNGVDIQFYNSVQKSPDAASLLFVGSMDYHANIDAVTWFVRESWPLLRRLRPDLRLQIVGRNPPDSVRALASESVNITGTVDDVRDYYAQAAAVVVPLRVGGGTRLKILEAMAAGVPVVSTRLGAEGLHVTHQRDILLADSAAELAEATDQVLKNSALHQSLVQQGLQLVQHSYGWPQLGTALFQVHQQAWQRSAART